MMMDVPAVQFERAGRTFGAVEALHPLELSVPSGRCVGIVGRNGSGKSTLLQLVAGTLRPSRGAVWIEGHDLSNPAGRDHARRVVAVGGAIGAFYPDLTVAEHLQLVAIAHGVADIDAAVERALTHAGLSSRADALVAQLSTGMRQQLDLGVARIRPARILVLDEPDRGLDPGARVRCWTDVADDRAAGRTVLVATHHPDNLSDLADEVLLLEDGEVVAHGDLAEVRRSAAAARLGLR